MQLKIAYQQEKIFMTQFSDKVRRHKEKMDAEEWGKRVKYLHASNGVLEVAFNNGEIHYEETATGKKWKEGVPDSNKTLLDRFGKFMADVSIGRDPYGK